MEVGDSGRDDRMGEDYRRSKREEDGEREGVREVGVRRGKVGERGRGDAGGGAWWRGLPLFGRLGGGGGGRGSVFHAALTLFHALCIPYTL